MLWHGTVDFEFSVDCVPDLQDGFAVRCIASSLEILEFRGLAVGEIEVLLDGGVNAFVEVEYFPGAVVIIEAGAGRSGRDLPV